MNPSAWATLLDGLSNYAAIGSAYCFARPILQRQNIEATAGLLGEAKADSVVDRDLAHLTRDLEAATRRRLASTVGPAQRWNRIGFAMLLLSFVLLLAATAVNAIPSK
jgi:hypothetical protein